MKHWHYVINGTDGTTEEMNLTINTTDPVDIWGDWKAHRQAQGKHYVFVGYTIVSVTPLPDFIPRVRPRRIVKQLPKVKAHLVNEDMFDYSDLPF